MTVRDFRAAQWARYCGRLSTAETIDEIAKYKFNEKSATRKLSFELLAKSKTKSLSLSPSVRLNNMNYNNNNASTCISPATGRF